MTSLTYRLTAKFILGLIGLLLIGSLPALFNGISLNISSYGLSLTSVLAQLIHPWATKFMIGNNFYHLFPHIFRPWAYSMEIYFISFFCAFIIALSVTFATLLMPRGFQKAVKGILFVLEALPDVLVIILLQLGVLWIYQRTSMLIANVASYGQDDRAILLPLIAMTAMPAIMLFRTMLLDFELEGDQHYVELAKSKGLKTRSILFVHMFRNAIIQVFLDSKYILWFMLSNLLMIEYLFNLRALTNFMLEHPKPYIFTIGLLLFFIPIFIFLAIGQVIIEKVTNRKMEV
ncbi:MAG TPA: ABC transporter permease subunit [Bacillales bacterium]|nr:ABC transporter permease subunit [Bacillales bacterium]